MQDGEQGFLSGPFSSVKADALVEVDVLAACATAAVPTPEGRL